jgi:RND family efflux transporter MFP subunit
MNQKLKWLVPVGIVVAAIVGARLIIANKPEPERGAPPVVPLAIEATRVQPTAYPVIVRSEGTVEPRTASTLIPQVSGVIRTIAPSFREGGFFERGDVLIALDPKDYELAIASAEAQVAQAESALEQELAQAEVVKNDWKLLGKKAPELGLRKPQIAAARAAVLSARAQLERARTDLERTKIRAPYSGQLLEKNVDVGQYVAPGTLLARIYATDYVEIRLPLSPRQLEFVELPDDFRSEAAADSRTPPEVTVIADTGRSSWRWNGRLVRAEGAIDTRSRQLYVVVQVDDPYGRGPEGRPPLRIGQFVQAEIQGRTLEPAFVLPRAALREGDEILVVNEGGQLERRSVTVAWTDDRHAVITAGLAAGEVVNVTPLAVAASGTQVVPTIDGQPPARPPQQAATGSPASP